MDDGAAVPKSGQGRAQFERKQAAIAGGQSETAEKGAESDKPAATTPSTATPTSSAGTPASMTPSSLSTPPGTPRDSKPPALKRQKTQTQLSSLIQPAGAIKKRYTKVCQSYSNMMWNLTHNASYDRMNTEKTKSGLKKLKDDLEASVDSKKAWRTWMNCTDIGAMKQSFGQEALDHIFASLTHPEASMQVPLQNLELEIQSLLRMIAAQQGNKQGSKGKDQTK